MSINIKDLTFSYKKGSKVILDNISTDIPEGGVTILLGLNGCGKTTLIKLITGLLKPSSGSISINGNEVYSMNVKERSKLIAYVSQKSSNVDDVPVRDYLSFGLVNELKFYESPNKEQINKVENKAAELNIKHLLDKNMNEISGGERQLVGICAALLQNSEIIVLDEPTSALDKKNENVVLNTLKTVAKSENKTIILSSHNPNHALAMDCEVILLKEGHIIERGYCRDIIRPEKLESVYGDGICLSGDLPYNEISYL